jgi:hypothetical protein
MAIAGAADDPTQALLVVIEGHGRRCALMVDELLGQHQVVIKSLGGWLGPMLRLSWRALRRWDFTDPTLFHDIFYDVDRLR